MYNIYYSEDFEMESMGVFSVDTQSLGGLDQEVLDIIAKVVTSAANDDGWFGISFTHYAPYNGCWWQTEIAIARYDKEDETIEAFFVYGGKLLNWRYGDELLTTETLIGMGNVVPFKLEKEDMLAYIFPDALPSFYNACREIGVECWWKCEGIGETTQPPYITNDMEAGNGGIGITIDGWYTQQGFYNSHVQAVGDEWGDDESLIYIGNALKAYDEDGEWVWLDEDDIPDDYLKIANPEDGYEYAHRDFKYTVPDPDDDELCEVNYRLMAADKRAAEGQMSLGI